MLKFMSSQSKSGPADDLVSGDSILIDATLARQIISECPYKGQRPVNADRVFLLADFMEHGTFLQNTQISFGRFAGRLHCVNGQHRLNAVDLSQVPQKFRIEIYDCANEADLDALYCRFDQPGGQRSLSQISKSLGLHDEGDGGGLRPAIASLLLKATPLLMIEFRRIAPVHRPRETRDLDAKKSFALQWKSAALSYQNCLDGGVGKYSSRFKNAGVVAVALATLRYQPIMAKEFWEGSIRGDMLSATDPRHVMKMDFLQRGRTSHEFDLAAAASIAWNAFKQAKPIKIIKVLPGSSIRVLGTPFVGDQ